MMKKITLLILLLITSLGYAQTSNYCSTEVFHLDITAETGSAINLTIVNTGAATMKVTAANADIDFLDLVGAITGSPSVSEPDTSVSGEISRTLTWTTAAPVNVTFQFIVWSKTTTGGNWQIENATTPFAGDCTIIPPAEDATLSNLTIDGTTVAGFAAGTLTYNIELPFGTTTVPTVVGTPTQSSPATAVTTAASSLPGSSTVLVTAQDGNATETYTLNFTVATTPPVTLPLDFSDPSHLFTADLSQGVAESVSIVNEKLEIIGNGNNWDNVFINFTVPVDLSNDAANTITFKMQSTTATAGVEHFHLVKMTGDPIRELSFSTIGQEEKTVVLDYPDNSGDSYTEMRIFVDAGNGATNTAIETYLIDDITAPAAAPPTCTDGIQNGDETGIDCGGTCAPCDLTSPTAFTAVAGTIGAFSVELLLNATDETSATITYDVAYEDAGGNPQTVQTTGDSGVQKSFMIPGLTPETAYSFDVSASDASGNDAANNAITVAATTVADTSTPCAGFSSEALEGSFSVGYNYSFVTSGTDVTVTFEILDTDKPSLNPQIFMDPPPTYLDMDKSGAPSYTYTFTEQTTDDVITFSLRAAYAGGLVRTKIFNYTVGDDCGGATAGIKDFEIEGLLVSPNPTNSEWKISTKDQEIQEINIFSVLGEKVISLKPNTLSVNIDASILAPGVYITTITTGTGTSSRKLIKN